MPGHRGHLLVKKARAMKAAEDPSYKASVYFCFKCNFFLPSQDHFDNHMTFLHLVPPPYVIGKFIALSTPNLLLSTFLRTSEIECAEDDSSTKDDSQGIDYKLEEYNKLFKNFEVSTAPTIEEWTKIASAAPQFKEIIEHQAKDYGLNIGIFSEPGAPDYEERVKNCRSALEESKVLKANICQLLENLDGKALKKILGYEVEYKKRKREYLKSVKINNSFLKAELAFNVTKFINE